jgi:transposase/uncharacterized coiled-coil protein SlyX
MRDLYHATRDDLIRIIRQQDEVIATLQCRVAAQEQEIAEPRQTVAALTEQVGRLLAERGSDAGSTPGTPKGMPGLKTTRIAETEPRPRARRAHGAGRRRMRPTRIERHALRTCPVCGTGVSGGTVKRSREVIELAPPRIEVIEHQYLERRCPVCGMRCVPAPKLDGVVSGQGRIGHRLTSLLAVLHQEMRMPVRTVQSLVQTLTGLHLSVGAIVAASQRVARRAEPVVQQIGQAIRASPVVHLDETGWRQNGRNGFIWTASTPTERRFSYGTRQQTMVDTLIGPEYSGVIVSDFYTAYTGDARLHQYCWAHLLRDLDELVGQQPGDTGVRGWAAALAAIFQEARAAAAGPVAERAAARRTAEATVAQLCQPWLEPRTAQTPLCTRILKYLPSLFVFVTDPNVPPTNNAAERSLRHLVTIRKISGGSRSVTGTETRMTLASLFGTWRLQGINPLDACYQMLASPQV